MQKYNVIAIDLAKNVFQACKLGSQGKVIYNREISRSKLKELLIKEKVSLVAMESCSSAHYWARYAKAAGHQVKVINARTVKGFQTKQKTDKNDAIATAASYWKLTLGRKRFRGSVLNTLPKILHQINLIPQSEDASNC